MRVVRRIRLAAMVMVLGAIAALGAHLWAAGYRLYIVHTGSMTPTLVPGDVVVDRPARGDYRVGNVITFRHSVRTTDVVTHRITAITPTGLVHTKGDANATADVWSIRPDQVEGVVSTRAPLAGYVIVFLRQPTGLAAAFTSTVALLLLWGLFFPSKTGGTDDLVSAVLAERQQGRRARHRAGTGRPRRRPTHSEARVALSDR